LSLRDGYLLCNLCELSAQTLRFLRVLCGEIKIMEILMPKVGLTMTEGSITEWHKREGEFVKKGELLFNFETEKSTLEYESPAEGVLQKILIQTGQVTACYVPVAVIGEEGHESLVIRHSSLKNPISPRAKMRAKELGVDVDTVIGSGPEGAVRERDVLAAAEKSKVRATPVARRIADELGIDLALLKGTGRNGEITREDVEKTADDAALKPRRQTTEAASPQSLSPARRVTAQRMAENVRAAPHVTLTTEADASKLTSAREQISAEMGEKLSYNALLVAIVAKALREHPNVNASWDESRIISHESVHIGLAVDTPKGLFVPVLKDADKKPLMQIHRELNDLVLRTLEGKTKLDELRGGTFTITNLGMFDIDAFTPIINLPEAAILGVGRIVKKAVVETAPNGDAHQTGDKIVARAMMTLSLSFDHRVIDGAPAAKFLQRIKQLIERPMALLV
jgi:pyruvate dehydrogenase E2 component (dihydrolipoamide acetyltransferase)